MAIMWYFAQNGERKGPVSTEALRALLADRQLSHNDLVWRKGLPGWVKAAQVQELVEVAQAPRSAKPPQAVAPQPVASQPASEPEELRLVEPEEELRLVEPDETPKPASRPVSQPAQQSPAPTEPDAKPQAAVWYFARDGQRHGPFTAQSLKEKALSGELLPTDHLWKNGLKDWVTASSLPGLKFPAPGFAASHGAADTGGMATDEPFALFDENAAGETTPDENSIFDVMNDPGITAAPTAFSQTPNMALMSAATMESRPQTRPRIEFEAPSFEWGYLLAAFGVSFFLAFVMAYFYGILRCYAPVYLVCYVCIFLIGSILSVVACSFFEKAQFNNQVVAIGYLLGLGVVVLYIAWATSIAWAISSEPNEMITTFEVLIQPAAVLKVALAVSTYTETTPDGGGSSSSPLFFFLEAVFITVAPVYMAYKRYSES